MYFGSDPTNENLDWSDNTQGLAHDDAHWFISQKARLWRVPVGVNLNTLSFGTPGVTTVELANIPQLASQGYNHFGDIDHYSYAGQGYVIVPIEALPDRSGVAIFRADATLAYVDHVELYPGPSSRQYHWPWVAVDPSGNLFSSDFPSPNRVIRYAMDWAAFHQTGQLVISNPAAVEIPLYEGDGDPLVLHAVQGGEFAPGGALLYLVGGVTEWPPCGSYANDGISVIDTQTWVMIRHSINSTGGYFEYRFEHCEPYFQEPEGLTIWDLESTPSPHVGKLHVLLVDNDWPSTDEINIKHYTNVISVDAANTGPATGRPAEPFRTVNDAVLVAWDGSEIRVKAGVYPETMTISKRTRLNARGGAVRIGG